MLIINDAVVSMELSMLSEEVSMSATFENESVNNDVSENSNADLAAEAVVLQLTVEDDPDPLYNSSSAISPVTNNVNTESNTHLTRCSRNTSSSLLDSKKASRQIVSDCAAAQAKIFREYLLDGDIQARILELDSSTGVGVCAQYV